MSNSKSFLLSQYKKNVDEIRLRAKAMNLTDSEIDQIFKECFDILKNDGSFATKSTLGNIFKITAKVFLCIVCIIFVLYVLLNVHQPTSSIVLRNVQGLIYPGLKVLRFLAVPVLKRFPSLTSKCFSSFIVKILNSQ